MLPFLSSVARRVVSVSVSVSGPLLVLACALCASVPLGGSVFPHESGVSVCSVSATSVLPFDPWAQGYRQVWSDEFHNLGNAKPNSAVWSHAIGKGWHNDGWGNHELQYYTNKYENSFIWNRTVVDPVTKATRVVSELFIRPLNNGYWDAQRNTWSQYTSARFTTEGKKNFFRGLFAARIRAPPSTGFWPAFWMMGGETYWPTAGEIDMLEMCNGRTGAGPLQNVQHATVHWQEWSRHQYYSNWTHTYNDVMQRTNEFWGDKFRTYWAEWTDTGIRMGIDRLTFFRFDTNTKARRDALQRSKMFLLLNVAVGGDMPRRGPDSSTVWGTAMQVDWIKVFNRLDGTGGATVNSVSLEDALANPDAPENADALAAANMAADDQLQAELRKATMADVARQDAEYEQRQQRRQRDPKGLEEEDAQLQRELDAYVDKLTKEKPVKEDKLLERMDRADKERGNPERKEEQELVKVAKKDEKAA